MVLVRRPRRGVVLTRVQGPVVRQVVTPVPVGRPVVYRRRCDGDSFGGDPKKHTKVRKKELCLLYFTKVIVKSRPF